MHSSLVFIRRKQENWEFSEGGGWMELDGSTPLSACEALEKISRLFPGATVAIGMNPAVIHPTPLLPSRSAS